MSKSVGVSSKSKGKSSLNKKYKYGGNKKAGKITDAAVNKYLSALNKAIIVAMLFIIFYSPYFRGLFFETEFLKAEIFVFIAFAAFTIYKISKKEKLEFSTPLDYASLAFVIVYLISIIASVSLNLAVEEWLKYCMYFAVFFILTDLAADYRNRVRTLWAITVSAIGVCIIGIDAFAGNKLVDFLNNLFNRYYLMMGMHIPENGTFFGMKFAGRLSSTLQYPNTLAAYLIAAFFITAGLSLLSRSWFHRAIASFAGFLFFVSLVFTLSRGALLIIPVILVLFIIVLPKGHRVKGVIYTLVPLLASIPSVVKISGIFNTNPNGNPEIWLWILPGVVLSIGLSFISDFVISFFEGISWKVYIGIFTGLAVAACIGLIVILNIREPLAVVFPENLQAESASIMRSIILEPGREYSMSLNIGKSSRGEGLDYEVNIFSNNEKEILREKPRLIKSITGKAEQDDVLEKIEFQVPSDSKIMYIYFYNKTRGTEMAINSCVINDSAVGELVRDMPLQYKYVPELIVSRLQDIQVNKSSIERMVFYKNGLEMYKDHWLIGAGGSAWSLLYFSYQSYLYFSTQVHNYFIQTAVEAGIPGMLAVLFLLFSIIYIFIKQRYNKNVKNDNAILLQSIIFTVIAAMIVHAFIDFDFTYPSMLILLWALLAVYNAGARETALQAGGYRIPLLRPLKCSYAIILIIMFAFIIRGAMALSAITYSTNALDALKVNNIELSIKNYETAAELNPMKPDYKINYASLVIQDPQRTNVEMNKANKWMGDSEALSRYDVSLLPFVSKYYFSIGNIPKALEIIEDIVNLRPFRVEEWEQLVGACDSAWDYYLQEKENKQAADVVNRALAVIPWATEENKRNLDPFIFNSSTSQMLEKLAYYKATQENKEFSGDEIVAFYSLSHMDIDSNGIPDQWNTTSASEYVIKADNNMLNIEKISNNQDSFMQSRVLNLQANKEYKLELEYDPGSEATDVRYFIQGVSTQVEKLESVNNIYQSTFSTPEALGNCALQLFLDSSCTIKDLRIIQIK